ncbi:MAG: hypothetical protein V1922_01785 [bacterium]
MSRQAVSSQAHRRLSRVSHDHAPSVIPISESPVDLARLVQVAAALQPGRLSRSTIIALALLGGVVALAGTGCSATPPQVTPGNLVGSGGATIGCISGPSAMDIKIAGAANSTITPFGPIHITQSQDGWDSSVKHLTITPAGGGYEEPASLVVEAQSQALIGSQTEKTTRVVALCVDTKAPLCEQTKIGWSRESRAFTGEVLCHEDVRLRTSDMMGTYSSGNLDKAWTVPLGLKAGAAKNVALVDVAGNTMQMVLRLPADLRTQPSLLIDKETISQSDSRVWISGLGRENLVGADMTVAANGAQVMADATSGAFKVGAPLRDGDTQATVTACAPDGQCAEQTVALPAPYHPFQEILEFTEFDPQSQVATLKLQMTGGSRGNIAVKDIKISASQGLQNVLEALFPVNCSPGQTMSGDEYIAHCRLPNKDWPAHLHITIPDKVGNEETIDVKVGKDFTAFSLLGLLAVYAGGFSVAGAALFGAGKGVQALARRERRQRNRTYFELYRNQIVHGNLTVDDPRGVSFHGVNDPTAIAGLKTLLATRAQLDEVYMQITNGRVNEAAYTLEQGFDKQHEFKGYITELYHELVRNMDCVTGALDRALLTDLKSKQNWGEYRELIDMFKILVQRDENTDRLWRKIRRYELEAEQEFKRQPENEGRLYEVKFTKTNIMRLLRGYAKKIGDTEMVAAFR